MKKSKKILALALSAVLSLGMFNMPVSAAATGSGSKTNAELKKESIEKEFDGSFFSATGFVAGGVNDRSQYKEGMDEYYVVNSELEFLKAIKLAKQGVVKVIEIRADLNMGWWELTNEEKNVGSGIISAMSGIDVLLYTPLSNPTLLETGLSDMRLNTIDGLTIFSQTGNKILHTQIIIEDSVNDLVMRNIHVDEVWEWDDFTGAGFGSTGGTGDHKRVGWAPMKINGAKNVWLDHCSFGLGFDGCVDLENGAEGISLTWCKVGDTDVTVGSMIYKTAMYMEQLYQESIAKENPKLAFTAYRIMRENGLSVEEIMTVMAYHSKVHLCGAGDKDTWLVPLMDEKTGDYQFDYSDGMKYTKEALGYDKTTGNVDYSKLTNDLANWLKDRKYTDGTPFGTINTMVNYDKADANELIELTLAYNQYWNVGQRVPMIRGGVGHLYNCYINDSGSEETGKLLARRNSNGDAISTLIKNAGSDAYGKLERTLNARNGASIAADTCVWQNVEQPVPGTQYCKDDLSNMNSPWHATFGYNYTSIVNSRVQLKSSSAVYDGNSSDNNGDNDFMKPAFKWKDTSIPFSWNNLAIKNAYRAEKITDQAVALANYDKLTYSYQTFPLDSVEDITNKYSGSHKIKMSAEDWLKVEYNSDFNGFEIITLENAPAATGVALTVTSATVYMDESEHLQLTAEILPYNAKEQDKDLVWTSSDTNILTVNDCGLVTPVNYGEATVKVKLNDFTAECKVTVAPSPKTITVTNIPVEIYVGDIFTLSATVSPKEVTNKEVVWNTNTSSIDCLDKEKGIFQAVKAGKRNLTVGATSKFVANRVGYQGISGKSESMVIKESVPVTGVSISGENLDAVTPGSVVELTANVMPSDASNKKVVWTSSDESIAKVDENGKLTAVTTGSAIITATTVNYGLVATVEAVVTSVPKEDVTNPDDPADKPDDKPNENPDDNNPEVPSGPSLSVTLYGDADVSGKVDLNDAKIALKLALGIKVQVTDQGKLNADYDANGKIDLNDAKYILKEALGIKVNIDRTKNTLAKKLGL